MKYINSLGFKGEYLIDAQEVEEKYLALQAALHPDIHGKENIVEMAQLNDAYATLMSDYLRAEFMLNLMGIDLRDEHYHSKLQPSQEFLESYLDECEKISAINDLDMLYKLSSEAQIERNTYRHELDLAFKEARIHDASMKAILLKYNDNMIQRINKKIEECF